ncbi:MAG TPA: FAD:protein FMN transferase [Cellvibrionaceae bacterium]
MVRLLMSPEFGVHHKARQAVSASLLFFSLLISACSSHEETLPSHKISGQTMGTVYHVTVVANKDEPFEVDVTALQQAIDAELVKINQMMSTYIADSELMQFNRGEVGEWQALSQPLLEVFAISREVSEKSDGAFDITVAPLVNLWGFGPEMQPQRVPSEVQLLQAQKLVGYGYLDVDAQNARRMRNIQVDLSAVAKGYGADWVAAFLYDRGFSNYMVEIGGDARVNGVSSRGDAWRIAIERPSLLQEGVFMTVALNDQAVATSGDYRNYFEVDGIRFSHTIDPATGRPIKHNLVSVTVITDTAAKADAWATALNVLGPERGMSVANDEGLAVYMIVKTDDGFKSLQSNTFARFESQ